jgi:putative ATP-dependent endonuclease of OLD family
MFLAELRIENFRMFGEGEQALVIPLRRGLTALVGENDSGKTSVIDALRFALGTTDQDWFRLEESDFYQSDTKREIRILCRFENLNSREQRAFVEYLTYGDSAKDEPLLYINWTAVDTGAAPKGRPFRRVEIRSGKKGDGPQLAAEVREMLRATYLRPLRDAESEMSAGRGSRLSQVLHRTGDVNEGKEYDPHTPSDPKQLNVRGIGDFANALLEQQKGINDTRGKIDSHLTKLSLNGDPLKSRIKVNGAKASEDSRLRHLLEKLDLSLGAGSQPDAGGKLGLGSNNLLFMACELLLVAQDDEGNKLLLIEEPEAHLHTQRQLRVMKYLQDQAAEKGVQIIVTTHSPNLASTISLDNMVMLQNGRAFSLAKEDTNLEPSDYRFLQRFLDVTKANLFFARGVMIVEGDAENILLPTLAKLIGRDFTEYGVSIVNVGGVGLRRYARIFQRRDIAVGQLAIPVACVTDMDVMPDCAKLTIKKDLPTKGGLGESGLKQKRIELCKKTSGQTVKTFIADEWTLEYDLAYFGLAKDVYVAARLAKRDEALAKKGEDLDAQKTAKEKQAALTAFNSLEQELQNDTSNGLTDSCTNQELLATKVYALFTTGTQASKTIAAQYLAEVLENKQLTPDAWRKVLPPYLVEAINYVAGTVDAAPTEKD